MRLAVSGIAGAGVASMRAVTVAPRVARRVPVSMAPPPVCG